MGQYMLIYTGGGGMDASPEERDRIMGEWAAWYEGVGESIVDYGSPFGESRHLTGDGEGEGPLATPHATGYTLIEADSLDGAMAACQGHPHLAHGGQVQVFSCIDMNPQ